MTRWSWKRRLNGRADGAITHNVRDFAKGAARFGSTGFCRPGELLKELRS